MREGGCESAKECKLHVGRDKKLNVASHHPCNESDAKFGPSSSYRDGLEASMSNTAPFSGRSGCLSLY